MRDGEMPLNAIRGWFVASDESLAERMRLRRWKFIRKALPEFSQMRILDLGGTMRWWLRAPMRPCHVTIVNLDPTEKEDLPWLKVITGDACQAQTLVSNERFDLVFSNSLIEHVGGHRARVALSAVIRSLAPRYVVQTPYRYFPIEPHWLFPFMQFMPLPIQRRIACYWPLGYTRGWNESRTLNDVMSTELIGLTEMREYFPDGELYWERFFGFPKSIIMIR